MLFFELEPWEKEYLNKKNSGLEAEFIDGILDENFNPNPDANPYSDTKAISIFVDSKITDKVLDKFPHLKLITTRSTGFDHIDLDLCKKRGVQVANVPSYGEDTVAEFAFALILTLSRKIYESYDRIRETGSFSLEGMRGFDLKGKILGVIGTGRIGKNVIEIAKGFNMEIVAHDKFPDMAYAEKMNYKYLSLEDVLRLADIVTLHVPYTAENHHLINEGSLALMKSGVYLINTARGALVETDALFKALKAKVIAGAALDVLEEEGVVKDELNFLSRENIDDSHDLKTVLQNHALVDMPNVIVTPHNAFNTWEAMKRILDTTIENAVSYFNGVPKNLVG